MLSDFKNFFSQKEFLLAYLFSGTYRGFGIIKNSGGSNGELTVVARPYVQEAWRYVAKHIIKLKTLANFEKSSERLHQMLKCMVNQTNQEPMWRVLGTCNDVQRWRQMAKSQPIDDVINKAALHSCSLIPNSTECERSFSKCGLASAGNKGKKGTKVILAHHQIAQAADIWKENEIEIATPGSISARLLRKSTHKHERVASWEYMVPLVDEDLVEALLDSPWIASDTSDSEAEEEQTDDVVVVRKLLTFRVSEEQFAAWKWHNSAEMPGFWNKYSNCSSAQVNPVDIGSVIEYEADLYGGEQDW